MPAQGGHDGGEKGISLRTDLGRIFDGLELSRNFFMDGDKRIFYGGR